MKTPGKPYQEAVGSYDANGNIRTLQRNATLNVLTADNADLSIADFTYHYGDNANTLQSITEPDRTFRTYTYDKLGQMTKETEGDKSKFVVYDVTGKVTAVYADASYTQPLTTFQYDDRGFRLAKTTYDADKNYVAIQKTWYVRDASGTMVSTYEDDLTDQVEAKPTEVPVYGSGKIGLYKPAYGVTFYEVTDHLGNVRAVIGDDMTLTYTATMESDPETRDKELNQYGFTNLNSVSAPLFNTTPNGDAVCKVSYQANQTNDFTPNPIGVGKMVWVHPGDKIKGQVNARYVNFSASNINPIAGLAGLLTTAFSNTAIVDGVSIFNVMNNPEALALSGLSSLDDAQPHAFLNYVLFNANFKLVDAKSIQVSSAAEFSITNTAPEVLSFDDISIEKEGYMYVYVSNMSDEDFEMYFDDLQITHTYSNIVAGGDFYPYGLAIKDRQIDREKYRFGYQGQNAEKDNETGWNHFELREYDPVIGRWMSVDPYNQYFSPYVGMGNNPINNVDINGGEGGPVFIRPSWIDGYVEAVKKDFYLNAVLFDKAIPLEEVKIFGNRWSLFDEAKFQIENMKVDVNFDFNIESRAGLLDYDDRGATGYNIDLASARLFEVGIKGDYSFTDNKGTYVPFEGKMTSYNDRTEYRFGLQEDASKSRYGLGLKGSFFLGVKIELAK